MRSSDEIKRCSSEQGPEAIDLRPIIPIPKRQKPTASAKAQGYADRVTRKVPVKYGYANARSHRSGCTALSLISGL